METPAVFQPAHLDWKGTRYTIPADRLMMGIAVIEAIEINGRHCCTLPALSRMSVSGEINYTAVAYGYAALLRYAGCKVTDEEIYRELFNDRGAKARGTLMAMLAMMFPPSHLQEVGEEAKKPEAGANTETKDS